MSKFLIRFLELVPVTTQIGTPIVNLPGCVTAHEKSDKNDTIVSDDPKGAKIFCDGTVPSFNPIQYEPENMTFEQSSPVPKVPGPPETPPPKTPEIPKTDPVTAVTEETVEEVPDTDWVEEYLPPVSTVTTTASIAVVAVYLSTVGETVGRSFVETNQTNDQESADESPEDDW